MDKPKLTGSDFDKKRDELADAFAVEIHELLKPLEPELWKKALTAAGLHQKDGVDYLPIPPRPVKFECIFEAREELITVKNVIRLQPTDVSPYWLPSYMFGLDGEPNGHFDARYGGTLHRYVSPKHEVQNSFCDPAKDFIPGLSEALFKQYSWILKEITNLASLGSDREGIEAGTKHLVIRMNLPETHVSIPLHAIGMFCWTYAVIVHQDDRAVLNSVVT